MATSFELVHSFPNISLELFEKHLNHPELNKMLEQMPSFESRRLIDSKTLKNGNTKWVFDVVAKSKLPAAIQKVAGQDSFRWIESSTFFPKKHCIEWEISPPDRESGFSGHGTWLLEEDKKGTVRTIGGEIKVDMLFVGKLIEKFIVDELKKNYDVEHTIQQKFYEKMK